MRDCRKLVSVNYSESSRSISLCPATGEVKLWLQSGRSDCVVQSSRPMWGRSPAQHQLGPHCSSSDRCVAMEGTRQEQNQWNQRAKSQVATSLESQRLCLGIMYSHVFLRALALSSVPRVTDRHPPLSSRFTMPVSISP